MCWGSLGMVAYQKQTVSQFPAQAIQGWCKDSGQQLRTRLLDSSPFLHVAFILTVTRYHSWILEGAPETIFVKLVYLGDDHRNAGKWDLKKEADTGMLWRGLLLWALSVHLPGDTSRVVWAKGQQVDIFALQSIYYYLQAILEISNTLVFDPIWPWVTGECPSLSIGSLWWSKGWWVSGSDL